MGRIYFSQRGQFCRLDPGPTGMQSRIYPARLASILLVALLSVVAVSNAQTQPAQATSVPLILPSGLAYDVAGNLYFAETSNHVVRRVTPGGAMTTFAGTGVQGFGGDGGLATAAMLDSPLALALDAAGDLYIADSHNHRIRRVDGMTGIVTSLAVQVDLPSSLAFDPAGQLYVADQRAHVVRRIDLATNAVTLIAGNGMQGYSGDGGPARLAAIDSPTGTAVDAGGNLFVSDTHNDRIRRVDAVSGIITSVAGTGQPGFSGDSSSAAAAALNLPRGLALDAAGNLFVVDSRNERIRRIDAITGQMSTIAGTGTQAFSGDSNPAVAASMDVPRAVTISPGNLPTVADSGNQRIRQVDPAGDIHTIAGLGTTLAGTLTLSGPSVTLYGTGALTATLVASPATGSVTFFDTLAGANASLGSVVLSGNVASLQIASLAAGLHRLSATYPGDTLHSAAQSGVDSVTITPAPVVVSPNSAAMLYGQTPPTLTGTLAGVLPQDRGLIILSLASQATSVAGPGQYPIVATISGAAAGNYALSQGPAEVMVAPAPSSTTLSNALAVHVGTSTSGVPSGTVTLYDGGAIHATAVLSNTGDAAFAAGSLSNGTHTLTAVYGGNADFLASTSNSTVATIGVTTASDFSLAATGQTAVTVTKGSAAQFSFAVNPLNGSLSSPILLTVSGLPTGATASFNPAYLPPANTPAAFILTIQTSKSASLMRTGGLVFAMMLPMGFLLRGRRSRAVLVTVMLAASLGCGDRISTQAASAASASYNVTVIGTSTSVAGTTLQHTAVVTLTLQ